MRLDEKLFLLRKGRKLSYHKVAEGTGVAPNTYWQWEQGCEPTRLKLDLVLDWFAQQYGVSLPQEKMRDEALALKFTVEGKPYFQLQKDEERKPPKTATPLRAPTLSRLREIQVQFRNGENLSEEAAQEIISIYEQHLEAGRRRRKR